MFDFLHGMSSTIAVMLSILEFSLLDPAVTVQVCTSKYDMPTKDNVMQY